MERRSTGTEDYPQGEVLWRCLGSWLPLALIIGLAVTVRWRVNFGGRLMPSVNGPYYLVQVRWLLRDGRLGFPDFPFVFWLEALIARLLFALKTGAVSDCIIRASKGVDAVFPALAAVPAFLVTRAWGSKEARTPWSALTVAVFTVLYFPALVMTSGFQKNAAGMVWLLWYAYYLYRVLQRGTWRNYIATGAMFVLTGLTHIGCFGVAIVFLLAAVAASLLLAPIQRRVVLVGVGGLLLLMAATAGGLYIFFDPARVERLLGVFLQPLALFQRPVLFTILSGQQILTGPPDLVNLITVNVLAIVGIALLTLRWATIEPARRPIIIGAAVTTLFLASPLIGQEWAVRLLLMAYIPAAVVLAFLLTYVRNRSATYAVTAIVFILVVIPAARMLGRVVPSSISEAAYDELYEVRTAIAQPEETLVLARHGLEWWAAWVLGTHVGYEYAVDADTWDRYAAVLYLEQIAGAADFGPTGPGGLPFPEVRTPTDAEMLFEGQYFRLAKATNPPEVRTGYRNPPAVVGQIVRITESHLQIRAGNETVSVELADETSIELGPHRLAPGAGVQVWGNWRLFSRTLVASLIAPARRRPPLPVRVEGPPAVEGRVTGISGNALDVQQHGMTTRVEAHDDTKLLTMDGQLVTLADIQPGDFVIVWDRAEQLSGVVKAKVILIGKPGRRVTPPARIH